MKNNKKYYKNDDINIHNLDKIVDFRQICLNLNMSIDNMKNHQKDKNTYLDNSIPIAQALEALLFPHAEIVIHDLKSNTIYAIFNSFSKRKPGDPSLIDTEINLNPSGWYGPYQKMNWDGRQLKSITSVIKNEKQESVGLLCLNLDISNFEACTKFFESFTNSKTLEKQPHVLFKDDWQEQINNFIISYKNEHKITHGKITKKEGEQLLSALVKNGAFEGKHAAAYIARVLKISRASVYNYLKKKGST